MEAARETFDEVALAELITSIQELGIIEPLIVEQEGGNFRIHAGHRRWIAATAAKLPTVPCMVYAPGTAKGEALKHHENKFREDLNPAEEARYFQRLLNSTCEGDTDKLCLFLGEVRGYVEGRLLLLAGWPETLAALSEGFVSLGVVQELNRITDHPTMLMYLDAAARGGASVRTVREWRTQWERTQQFSIEPAATAELAGAADHPVPASTMVCFLCLSEESPHDMELAFMHKTCRRLILQGFLDKLRGE